MTWGELQVIMRAKGATDSSKIFYADMNYGGVSEPFTTNDIEMNRDNQIVIKSELWEPCE